MIYLNFNLTNPFSNRWKNVWHRVVDLPVKYKVIELELFEDTSIVSFTLRVTTRQDHAGLMIDLGLLGYSVSFQYYDVRHWNREQGRYYKYSEELGEH